MLAYRGRLVGIYIAFNHNGAKVVMRRELVINGLDFYNMRCVY